MTGTVNSNIQGVSSFLPPPNFSMRQNPENDKVLNLPPPEMNKSRTCHSQKMAESRNLVSLRVASSRLCLFGGWQVRDLGKPSREKLVYVWVFFRLENSLKSYKIYIIKQKTGQILTLIIRPNIAKHRIVLGQSATFSPRRSEASASSSPAPILPGGFCTHGNRSRQSLLSLLSLLSPLISLLSLLLSLLSLISLLSLQSLISLL